MIKQLIISIKLKLNILLNYYLYIIYTALNKSENSISNVTSIESNIRNYAAYTVSSTGSLLISALVLLIEPYRLLLLKSGVKVGPIIHTIQIFLLALFLFNYFKIYYSINRINSIIVLKNGALSKNVSIVMLLFIFSIHVFLLLFLLLVNGSILVNKPIQIGSTI